MITIDILTKIQQPCTPQQGHQIKITKERVKQLKQQQSDE